MKFFVTSLLAVLAGSPPQGTPLSAPKSGVVEVNGLLSEAPVPDFVSEASLIQTGLCGNAPRAGRHLYGCFHYDFDWFRNRSSNVLTIEFKLGITISNALKPTLKAKVIAHERQHFFDFRALAAQMKEELQRSADEHRDPDIENRLAWFKFDVCRASEAYHVSLKQSLWGIAACAGLEPKTARPL